MFGNVLASALRNLVRNRLHGAILIFGLAVGMAAAILTGLYIRDEAAFDRFIPGHETVQVLAGTVKLPDRPPMSTSFVPTYAAAWLRSDFPEVKRVSRLLPQGPTSVRRGDMEGLEPLAWGDPDLFKILPMPVLAGDPAATLAQPDGVVLTRRLARKYFGRDAPLGETLQLDRKLVLRVGAVLNDLPANTHLKAELFASNLNAASNARSVEATPYRRGDYWIVSGRVYVQFASPAAAARVQAALPAFTVRHMAYPDGKFVGGRSVALFLVPLDGLHLYPFGGATLGDDQGGSRQILVSLGLIAALILLSAAINFVNLTTARATRRAVEVGVRKAVGADRRRLALQFLGESVLYALLALLLAMAMVELLLPGMRALLDRPLAFDYGRDPGLLCALLGLALTVGVLAGAYPAVVQSRFRPAQALKGSLPPGGGSIAAREALVVVQFAILVGLILGAVVVASQTRYLLAEGLGLNKAQMVMMGVFKPDSTSLCRDPFIDQVRAIPGVAGAACSSSLVFDLAEWDTIATRPDGSKVSVWLTFVDHGFFELYGLKPLAGRFFSPAHPADEASPAPKTVVINETAARALGYAAPSQAVGHTLKLEVEGPATPQIVGIVPDFAFNVLGRPPRPAVYLVSLPWLDELSIKLRPGQIPQALRAIDEAWTRSGVDRPVQRRFVDDYVQDIYRSTLRQSWLVGALTAIAVAIAALGLFALAAFTAERRTKEIGIRKAMGASTQDILRLLLWQFTRPVLLAGLIAWPVAWWASSRWLQGFARRIELSPWLFLAAAAAALVIAAVTVCAHALRIAAAKPVGALRYE